MLLVEAVSFASFQAVLQALIVPSAVNRNASTVPVALLAGRAAKGGLTRQVLLTAKFSECGCLESCSWADLPAALWQLISQRSEWLAGGLSHARLFNSHPGLKQFCVLYCRAEP